MKRECIRKWVCGIGVFLLAGTGFGSVGPAFELKVNVSAWLEYYSDLAEPNEAYANLMTLGVSNVAVSVLVEEGAMVALARIETARPDARSAWLSHTNLVQLESVSENGFKWVPSQKKSTSLMNPIENLHIRFFGNSVLMAPSNMFLSAESLQVRMDNGLLVQGSVHMASLLDPLLVAAEKKVSEQEEGFGKAIMSGMLKSVTEYMTALRDVTAVSVEITSLGRDTRAMTLVLEYAEGSNAIRAKAFFDDSSDAWKNPEIPEKLLKLAGLVDTENFRGTVLAGNALRFSYEWPASDDQAMMQLIGQAVLGSLFSFGDSDDYPLLPEQTIDAPRFESQTDLDAAQLEKALRSSLFPGHTWKHQVELVVDYLDVPNVDLLQGTVTNVSVLATHGVELAKPGRVGQFHFNSDQGTASIALPTEESELSAATASFTLELNLPMEVETFRLSDKSPLIERDDEGICLVTMSNSVVRLRAKGISLRDAKVYALNKDGQYLNRKGASWSTSNYRARYNGIPASVEIVLPVKTKSMVVDFKDISVGQSAKLKMPAAPTNSVVTRYRMEPIKAFDEPDRTLIAAGEMTYVTNTNSRWHQLKFPRPENVETSKLSMKVYLAGVEEFVVLSGRGGYASSGGQFYWSLQNTNVLAEATAIFGELMGSFWSEIETHSTAVSNHPVPLVTGQEQPAVSVEHNAVWIDCGQDRKVLDIQAFDETGRQLKKDNRTTYKNNLLGYFFWGMPSRVTVTYASNKESVSVPFTIELKAGGLEDAAAMQEKVAVFEERVAFMKEINKKASFWYGNLLAAHYYACNFRKEPRAAIPLEVAHSDPTSAAIFGYAVVPFEGYYFRKILDQRDVEKGIKTENYAWAGGAFEAPHANGMLLATPAGSKGLNVLVRWSDVYINFKDCSDLTQLSMKSEDLKAAGWIRVN